MGKNTHTQRPTTTPRNIKRLKNERKRKKEAKRKEVFLPLGEMDLYLLNLPCASVPLLRRLHGARIGM